MIRTHEAQSPAPSVDLATQYASMPPEIDAAVSKVIRETDFILGREVLVRGGVRGLLRFTASAPEKRSSHSFAALRLSRQIWPSSLPATCLRSSRVDSPTRWCPT